MRKRNEEAVKELRRVVDTCRTTIRDLEGAAVVQQRYVESLVADMANKTRVIQDLREQLHKSKEFKNVNIHHHYPKGTKYQEDGDGKGTDYFRL